MTAQTKKVLAIIAGVVGGIIIIILGVWSYRKSQNAMTPGPDTTEEADKEFDKVADYASGSLIDAIRAGTITGDSATGEDKIFIQVHDASPGVIIAIRNLIQSYKTNPQRRTELINIAVTEKNHQFHTIMIREAIKQLIPSTVF